VVRDQVVHQQADRAGRRARGTGEEHAHQPTSHRLLATTHSGDAAGCDEAQGETGTREQYRDAA
jgi:hypothetical protein